ncbi:hypothetical protein ACIRPX_20870 [Streptomyces sp. NPDC101225]|uniref:hypothetical protein n=1 Tax=Streptomyces sp. NPDC101225 TaxID=3366135 RepID=UPI0037FB4E15
MYEPTHEPDPVRRRDRGLLRVGSTTRRTASAATAAALLLGAGYAHVLPSVSSLASDAVEHSSGDHQRSQAPANAPGSTTQQPQTTSGAS